MNSRLSQTLARIGVVGGVGIALYMLFASTTGTDSPSLNAIGLAVGTGGVLIAFLSYIANNTARAIDRLEERLNKRIDELKEYLTQRIDDLKRD